ncbi:hypothetical protein PVAP13_8KG057152 [Panicum virgatum]|uniref:Uncharacterized protein n=1 Tax=Panicum virgatum TaxID=38727 RepID=A0A8T0PHJ5_PANVG|nr:hypothetical protein PVAP13_8KG057152 [Panicum virgatum]
MADAIAAPGCGPAPHRIAASREGLGRVGWRRGAQSRPARLLGGRRRSCHLCPARAPVRRATPPLTAPGLVLVRGSGPPVRRISGRRSRHGGHAAGPWRGNPFCPDPGASPSTSGGAPAPPSPPPGSAWCVRWSRAARGAAARYWRQSRAARGAAASQKRRLVGARGAWEPAARAGRGQPGAAAASGAQERRGGTWQQRARQREQRAAWVPDGNGAGTGGQRRSWAQGRARDPAALRTHVGARGPGAHSQLARGGAGHQQRSSHGSSPVAGGGGVAVVLLAAGRRVTSDAASRGAPQGMRRQRTNGRGDGARKETDLTLSKRADNRRGGQLSWRH